MINKMPDYELNCECCGSEPRLPGKSIGDGCYDTSPIAVVRRDADGGLGLIGFVGSSGIEPVIDES